MSELKDILLSGDIESILLKLSDAQLYGVNTLGVNVFNIYSEADFPTPVGGVSTLVSGKYIIKKPITISTINEFKCAVNSIIEWTSEDKENHILTSSHSDKTLFNLILGKRFKCTHASFLLNGDNAKFINITGAGFNSKFNDFRVTFTGTGTTIGGTTNTFDGTNEFLDGTIAGFKDGLTINNTGGTQVIGVLFISDFTGTDAILKAINVPALAVNFNTNVFIGGASQSNYYIDPTITVPMQVQGNITGGPTSFFKSGSTGIFTAVADASIGATAITSVTDSSGVARFHFTGPTVYENQEVVVSGFITNTDYNGACIVTATDGTSYFEIACAPFGSNETGSFLSNSVTLTEVGTALTEGETVLLDTTLSTMYDGGTYVYNKQTNSVQVNKTWDSTITGTWDSGSLTEDSKYVNSVGNGAQPDSSSNASVFVSGNAVTFDTTGSGTWDPMDLGTALEGQSNSRFKLIDPATGEMEYTGLTPINVGLAGSISALKAAASVVNHKFRVNKTQGSEPFDAIEPERGLSTAAASIALVSSIHLNPGDRFRPEIASQTSATTVTITDLSITTG
jgi:hypothetical protein